MLGGGVVRVACRGARLAHHGPAATAFASRPDTAYKMEDLISHTFIHPHFQLKSFLTCLKSLH